MPKDALPADIGLQEVRFVEDFISDVDGDERTLIIDFDAADDAIIA